MRRCASRPRCAPATRRCRWPTGSIPTSPLRAPRARTGSSSCPREASCRSTSAACPRASAGRGPPSASRWAERTYDDLFALAGAPSRFAVSGGGRRLQVELGDGFPYAQVFAPPDEPVICFEPMSAPIDALRSGHGLRLVPAGGTARATWSLGVADMAP